MNSKYNLIGLIFLLSIVRLFSQSPQDLTKLPDYQNLTKYWAYKTILNNRNVLIGNTQGCSIPFDLTHHTVIDTSGTERSAKFAQFGDGGVRLGWYISVLATEYKLLSDNNLNGQNNKAIENNITEMYFALSAYYRLERKVNEIFETENYYRGFFIRDDVEIDFVRNYNNKINCFSNSKIANGVGELYTAKTGCQNLTNRELVEILIKCQTAFNSYDQVRSLFMGFALIKKCVPSSVEYTYFDRFGIQKKSSILLMAQDITTRIMDNLWRNQEDNKSRPLSDFWMLSPPWQITLNPPKTCSSCKGEGCSEFTVQRHRKPCGIDFPYSGVYPVSKIANYILGRDNYEFKNSATEFLFKQAFKLNRPMPNDVVQYYFLNNWALLPDNFNLINENKLCIEDMHFTLPLLKKLIHGTTFPSEYETELKQKTLEVLNSAPLDGILLYNFPYPKYWRGSSNLSHNGESSRFDFYDDFDNGERTGLDYMLLHNLYYLNFGYPQEINYNNTGFTIIDKNEYPKFSEGTVLPPLITTSWGARLYDNTLGGGFYHTLGYEFQNNLGIQFLCPADLIVPQQYKSGNIISTSILKNYTNIGTGTFAYVEKNAPIPLTPKQVNNGVKVNSGGLEYNAYESITLKEGFHAQKGSYFYGKIDSLSAKCE